jgi:ABC-type nitrate/sulfonate/bicarbonate transport system substrate-binding protein
MPDELQSVNSRTGWTRRDVLRRGALFGLVAAPLALLAACAQPNSPPAPAASAPTSPPAAPAATQAQANQPAGTVAPPQVAAEKARLTYGKGGLATVAQTRGVFEPALLAQGISVEWIGPFPNHAPTMQAVSARSADFSFGGSTTPALAALLAGQPLKFVQMIFTRPRETAVLALPQSGIQSIPDLVGKKVAANRSGLGEFLLIAALENTTCRATRSKRSIWTRPTPSRRLPPARSMPGPCGVGLVKSPK